MYLESFLLPNEDREEYLIERGMIRNGGPLGYIDNTYPCRMFPQMDLRELDFDRITILYGGNGSGKSTLLNLIAEKLALQRVAPFNSSELFRDYVDSCGYTLSTNDFGEAAEIPQDSRIITSDDIFDYMLAVRSSNDTIAEDTPEAKEEWARLKYGENVRFRSMDDYEALRLQILSRRKSVSRRDFIRKTVGSEVQLFSNGETSLEYFDSRLKNDALYCLDEPENSLSPRLQLKLKETIEQLARYCGCQFILSTHSPFLLSLNGARIYDLDEVPVGIRDWWNLENTRTYYEFFKQNRKLFE